MSQSLAASRSSTGGTEICTIVASNLTALSQIFKKTALHTPPRLPASRAPVHIGFWQRRSDEGGSGVESHYHLVMGETGKCRTSRAIFGETRDNKQNGETFHRFALPELPLCPNLFSLAQNSVVPPLLCEVGVRFLLFFSPIESYTWSYGRLTVEPLPPPGSEPGFDLAACFRYRLR